MRKSMIINECYDVTTVTLILKFHVEEWSFIQYSFLH